MENYQAWVQDDIAPFSNLKYKSINIFIDKNKTCHIYLINVVIYGTKRDRLIVDDGRAKYSSSRAKPPLCGTGSCPRLSFNARIKTE